MSLEPKVIPDSTTADYMSRTDRRQQVLMTATMNFVAYFMGLGDDQATAESKVSQVSTEVAALLYVYTLGNTQPLLDAIQASTLPHMDQAAKDKLIGDLTITP
jgi:hypothetical protein